jgi:outer membrane lipoprotein-sorting protein
MLRKSFLCCTFLSLAVCLAVHADTQTAPANLSVAEIVNRNVSARGGLAAWRAVETMSWKGKMDAGGGHSATQSRRIAQSTVAPTGRMVQSDPSSAANQGDADKQVQLPFLLEQKRPRKSRLELEFAGKTAVQVYDGTNGWKLRPFLNRNDVEPYTPEEMKAANAQSDLDGLLIDYKAKGNKVELEGTDKVEGRDAYKLKVTTNTGDVRRVWVDAQSFLDVKMEGTPRRMDGRYRKVNIYLRDYKAVQGLRLPYEIETEVEGYRPTHKMTIESVVVNPKLEDSLFMKPAAK